VYAKGYFDGLEAANGGCMTPKRQQQLLQGQSSVSQKVFSHVPIQESWPAHRIAVEIERTTRSRLDAKVVDHCLVSLIEAGLVRQTGGTAKAREYQRAPVSSGTQTALDVLKAPNLKPSGREPASDTPLTSPRVENSTPPFVVLSTLNDRLFQVSQDLKEIAACVGDAILQIEEDREQNARDAETLRQLQALLGGLTTQK
jgi:hypothetical protein